MRVAVIGGGIGGLTSALILKRIGFNVKIFEARNSISCHRNIYSGLWNPTFSIFKQMNIFQEIEKSIHGVKHLKYQDFDGKLLLESSSYLNNLPDHPSFGYINHNLLLQTFYNHVKEDVRLNSRVTKIYRNNAEAVIEVEDQGSYTADVVIAADGFDSTVRKTVSGLDAIPQKSRGYTMFRGHISGKKCVDEFGITRTVGVGCHFTTMPTSNGVAWSAAVNDHLFQSNQQNNESVIDVLVKIFGSSSNSNNSQEMIDLIQCTDDSVNGIIEQKIFESGMKYQGWDAILKYQNGTTAPSLDDPLVFKPTALEDAEKMGYVSSESSQMNPPKRVSYREALANGMWRVRTAPLVFYIGDSAYQMDPILSQGAGLAIEGSYRLGKSLQNSPQIKKFLQNDENTNPTFDFDDLMPDLMECENQRYFQYLRLKRLTTLATSLQDVNTSFSYQVRNQLLRSTPTKIKTTLLNYLLEKSLYY